MGVGDPRSRSIEHDKTNHFLELGKAMPPREVRKVIVSDEIIKLGVLFPLPNFLDGVDGIGRGRTTQLAIVQHEFGFAAACRDDSRRKDRCERRHALER